MTFFLLAVLYVVFSLQLLPWCFLDLCYLTSLESGEPLIQEVVHPLYVPTLALWRKVLAGFGLGDTMAVSASVLNIFVMVLTTWALYRLTHHYVSDALLASLSAFLFGVSGFWWQGLRVTPYAMASLFAILTVYFMLVPSLPRNLLYPWVGIMAALSVSYHAASLSLVPVAVLLICMDKEERLGRRKSFLEFVGAFAIALTGAYAIWVVYNHFEPFNILRMPFGDVFKGVEQHSGTSIYTSGSLRKQALDYVAAIASHCSPFYPVGLAGPVVWAVGAWFAPSLRRQARAVVAAVLVFCFYSLFFLLNNTENGFIFISGAFLPMVMAMVASWAPWLRLAFVAVAVPSIFDQPLSMSSMLPARMNDPVYSELKFLASATRPQDMFVFPGCPFDEVFHFGDFNMVWVGEAKGIRYECPAPQLPLDGELVSRVSYRLESGGAVFFQAGDVGTEFSRAFGRSQKENQIFFTGNLTAQERRQQVASIREFLGRHFDFGKPLISPLGRYYERLMLKADATIADASGYRPPSKPLRPEAPLKGRLKWKERHLKAVLAANPSDPYALADLANLYGAVRGLPNSNRQVWHDRRVEAQLFHALALFRKGDLRAGFGEYDSAVRLVPDGAAAVEEYCRSHAAICLPLERAQTRIARLNEVGIRLLRAGETTRAMGIFDWILAVRPQDISALLNRGFVAATVGDLDGALAYYGRAIGLGPSGGWALSDALSARATVLSRMGRYEEAAADYERALQEARGEWPRRAQVQAERDRIQKGAANSPATPVFGDGIR